MRLMGSGRPPATDDVAAALTAAVGTLGQRPAITGHVLARRPDGADRGEGGRREQGFASLAGWVAKGANLLHAELDLRAGDRLALAGPPGWPLAAVALSAWWLGAVVVPIGRATDPAGQDAAVVVTHVGTLGASAAGALGSAWSSLPHFVVGDALDGTVGAEGTADPFPGVERWTDAITPHGDRPPPAAHDGDLVALLTDDGTALTQRALLGLVGDDVDGVVGMLRTDDEDLVGGPDAARRLATLALRPLVTGAATVVVEVDDPAREEHARSERVARWLG